MNVLHTPTVELVRAAFLARLTTDSDTKDRRKREFNQALFNAEKGWAVWSSTDLDMVMQAFDDAVRDAERAR